MLGFNITSFLHSLRNKNKCSENKIRLFLVDSSRKDRKLIKDTLSESNLISEIEEFEKGGAFLDSLDKSTNPYNAIDGKAVAIVSLHLSDKKGLSILKQIRASEKHKQFPVIMISKSATEEEIALACANLANAFLRKPIERKSLEKILESRWGWPHTPPPLMQ